MRNLFLKYGLLLLVVNIFSADLALAGILGRSEDGCKIESSRANFYYCKQGINKNLVVGRKLQVGKGVKTTYVEYRLYRPVERVLTEADLAPLNLSAKEVKEYFLDGQKEATFQQILNKRNGSIENKKALVDRDYRDTQICETLPSRAGIQYKTPEVLSGKSLVADNNRALFYDNFIKVAENFCKAKAKPQAPKRVEKKVPTSPPPARPQPQPQLQPREKVVVSPTTNVTVNVNCCDDDQQRINFENCPSGKCCCNEDGSQKSCLAEGKDCAALGKKDCPCQVMEKTTPANNKTPAAAATVPQEGAAKPASSSSTAEKSTAPKKTPDEYRYPEDRLRVHCDKGSLSNMNDQGSPLDNAFELLKITLCLFDQDRQNLAANKVFNFIDPAGEYFFSEEDLTFDPESALQFVWSDGSQHAGLVEYLLSRSAVINGRSGHDNYRQMASDSALRYQQQFSHYFDELFDSLTPLAEVTVNWFGEKVTLENPTAEVFKLLVATCYSVLRSPEPAVGAVNKLAALFLLGKLYERNLSCDCQTLREGKRPETLQLFQEVARNSFPRNNYLKVLDDQLCTAGALNIRDLAKKILSDSRRDLGDNNQDIIENSLHLIDLPPAHKKDIRMALRFGAAFVLGQLRLPADKAEAEKELQYINEVATEAYNEWQVNMMLYHSLKKIYHTAPRAWMNSYLDNYPLTDYVLRKASFLDKLYANN